VREETFQILLDALDEQLPAISRGPDNVVFQVVDGVGAFAKSHAAILPYRPHCLDRLYITRQESGGLSAD